MKDESTTSNNVFILNNIFTEQFGLDGDDVAYETQLKVVFGDLKTVKRILAVKALRRSTAERPYDTYDWLLPGLGLFHLRLNFLRLIHTIHWGGSEVLDQSTLQFAADRWGRSRVVEPNEFKALEDLIIHSYQARVVSALILIQQKSASGPHRREQLAAWLTNHTSSSWLETLESICHTTHLHWRQDARTASDESVVDEEFQNHIRFIHHTETYLQLKHAIRFADIGLLRLALRECAILFQAKAGGAPSYARELLRTIHITDSDGAAVELQRAVLINSLVTMQETPGHAFETDRLVEFLNAKLKTFQKERSIFTKNSDEQLADWALCAPVLSALKTTFETSFGVPNAAGHPEKSAAEDVYSLAWELSQSSMQQSAVTRFSAYRAADLFQEGLQRLSQNVTRHNADYAATKQRPINTLDVPDSDIAFLDPNLVSDNDAEGDEGGENIGAESEVTASHFFI